MSKKSTFDQITDAIFDTSGIEDPVLFSSVNGKLVRCGKDGAHVIEDDGSERLPTSAEAVTLKKKLNAYRDAAIRSIDMVSPDDYLDTPILFRTKKPALLYFVRGANGYLQFINPKEMLGTHKMATLPAEYSAHRKSDAEVLRNNPNIEEVKPS